jgi:hypothetical protein
MPIKWQGPVCSKCQVRPRNFVHETSIRFVLQDKAPHVAALGYVVGNSDGDYTSETRHRPAPLGIFGEEVRRKKLVWKSGH